MREILFRGKRVDNGEWVYGSLVIQNGEHISKTEVAPDEYYIFGKRGEHCLINHSTVGQYTGLTDKNGKKIFEGDIVRTHYANAPKAVFVETVVFDSGKFCATSTNEGCKTTAALWDGVPRLAIDKSVYMDEVEIIGNG